MDETDERSIALSNLLNTISACVPAIGTEAFIEQFLPLVSEVKAVQVTAYSYGPGDVHCLLSRNLLSDSKAKSLAAAYVDGEFQDDPLFKQLNEMNENGCLVVHLEDLKPKMSSEYLAKFFGAPGFRTKIAVLIFQDGLRIALNFYFDDDLTSQSTKSIDALSVSIFQLIGKFLATHFSLLTPLTFPLPLAALSDRERQVCMKMLEGKKAEIIAAEIGVAASSVVTYRQRAYQKLGISSRGQLFSICNSHKVDGAF